MSVAGNHSLGAASLGDDNPLPSSLQQLQTGEANPAFQFQFVATDDNPFVGLRPFESDETLLFFGRQQQTLDLLKRLHEFNFVGVTGTSGSGKSSLVRAGVIPRLKAGYLVNDRDHWIVAICKPGHSPICNLAEELLRQLPPQTTYANAAELEVRLKQGGIKVLLELLQPTLNQNINLFILVDQFEEIFRFALSQEDYDKKDEAIEFVNLLLQLAEKKELPIYVTLTMRSDFFGDCAQIFGLPEALNQSQYLVPRLTRQQLKIAIEGPVRLYRGNIDNGLITRLLNDVEQVKDELPLLQHALMRMWELDEGTEKGTITISDYEAIGGLQMALSNHAEEALTVMTDEEKMITKKIFQSLTAIDEKGRKVRRPARVSELVTLTGKDEAYLLIIIDRFIQGKRNFLIKYSSQNSDEIYIDISHESLIRQWGTLNIWVEDEAEAATLYQKLINACNDHKLGNKAVLSGPELHQMQLWFKTVNPTKAWAQRYSHNFEDHVAYLKKSEDEERRLKRIKKRNRLMVYAAVLVAFMLVSSFAYYINRTNNYNQRQLAFTNWTSSQTARNQNKNLDALHLIANAMVLTNEAVLTKDLLTDGQAFLPITALHNIVDVNTIVNQVSFSNDASLFVTAGNNGSVKIFKTADGLQVGNDIKNELPVLSACFNKNSTLLLTAGNDHTATLWSIATGKRLRSFAHDDAVISAVFSNDERTILTACADGVATEWNVSTGEKLATYPHPLAILSAVYSHDGLTIATAGKDFKATLWSVANKQKIYSFEHDDRVKEVMFSANDSLLLSISGDSTARLWNVQTHENVAVLRHDDAVLSAAFHSNGKWIVTGGNKKAMLWDIERQQPVGAEMLHDGRVYSFAFSNNGKWLATSGGDEHVRLWRMHQPIMDEVTIVNHNDIVTFGSLSNDGKIAVTASADSTARLWDATTGKQLFVLPHKDRVNTALFNGADTWVVTACNDSSARTWDVATGTLLATFHMNEAVNCAAISPDNSLLITAANDRTLTLWNVSNHNIQKTISTRVSFKKATFSPDGKTILLTGKDSSAYLYNLQLQANPVRLQHENLINSAIFNGDGSKIVTTSDDMTARIWDAKTFKQTGSNLQHLTAINSATFSNNNKWIITGGWQQGIQFWSLLNYQQLGATKFQHGNVTSVASTISGDKILSTGYDSIAIIRGLAADYDMPSELFLLQAKALTGAAYNSNKGTAECLSVKEWKKILIDYREQAKIHAGNCKYSTFNFWKANSK